MGNENCRNCLKRNNRDFQNLFQSFFDENFIKALIETDLNHDGFYKKMDELSGQICSRQRAWWCPLNGPLLHRACKVLTKLKISGLEFDKGKILSAQVIQWILDNAERTEQKIWENVVEFSWTTDEVLLRNDRVYDD